jgi:hexulose-6-phosphate isomerase
MANDLTRRQFLTTSACATTGVALSLQSRARAADAGRLKKALIVGKPTEENLKPIKEAGFDGVEAGVVSPEEAAEAKKIAENLGLRIHSVLRGWMAFNSEKPEELQASLKQTEAALRAAQAYGADAILLVPCRISGMPMPEPWEFKVRFDQKTGHLTAVAEGDNDKYKDYLSAHDRAYDTSLEGISKLIPVAEETGVVIALENVWNNLFVDPRHYAHFVDAFNSKWVQAYFDLGNHVKYSPTEEWVRVLGKRIAKVHVKDFKLNPDGHGGKFVDIRDGSVNWPVVRKALADIGYNGWMTIEGGPGAMGEASKRLDLIIAAE